MAITSVQAQTKKIAFKSHSGTDENFKLAFNNNLFDMDGSNFGMAPQQTVRDAQLDSVIFVSDSVAIMVTSEYCTKVDRATKKKSQPELWTAGRETVYNHPLFSKKHSLDSIKKVLAQQYNFKNPAGKTIFVGYDNKKRRNKNRSEVLPVTGTDNNSGASPFDKTAVTMLGLIFALSLLTGFIAWKYKKPQTAIFSGQ
jgi:hypothetical protein